MSISAFPKIFTIGSHYIQKLFDGPVEITEKIDGSQFVFGKVNGELLIRSKGAFITPQAPVKMFEEGVNYVTSIEDRIPDNTVFYGEYLQKPKHNILAYNTIPKNHIALFGVATPDGQFTDDWHELVSWAEKLDIDVVELLHAGDVKDVTQLQQLLETESQLGGQKIEGFVAKNYTPMMLGGQIIHVTSGKYVSEAFKEVHRKDWSREHTSGGKWVTFCQQFKSSARWEKAISHLRERGELSNSPRDIGFLIKEIQEDITSEEKEHIKNVLWQLHKDDVLRTAINGFPEWYKNKLLEGAFKHDEVDDVEGTASKREDNVGEELHSEQGC